MDIKERLRLTQFAAELMDIGLVSQFRDYDFYSSIEPLQEKYGSFYISTGVYKVTIILENSNYVIKFNRLNPTHYGANQVIDEVNNYQKAKTQHLDPFFSETIYGGDISGYNFSFQKKALCDEYEISDDIESILDSEILDIPKNYSGQNKRIAILIGSWAGEEAAEEVINFCEENNINDLHVGNWGYIDRVPIITDFSGTLEYY